MPPDPWLVGGWVRTWQRSLHGAVVALLSDLVVRVAQLYPCCASGARQRPRTVRLTHGCANSAPKARPLTRQCQLGTSISDRVNFTPQAYSYSSMIALSMCHMHHKPARAAAAYLYTARPYYIHIAS